MAPPLMCCTFAVMQVSDMNVQRCGMQRVQHLFQQQVTPMVPPDFHFHMPQNMEHLAPVTPGSASVPLSCYGEHYQHLPEW